MKFYLKLIFIIPILLSGLINAQSKKINLIGEWSLTDYWKNESDFILSNDNYASMSINGEFLDGKNFIVRGGKNNGQKGELKYLINYEKNPIEIDFIAIKDKEEKGRILGTIEPINENEFLMIWSFEGIRDMDFSEENREKILTAKRKN